MADWIFLLRGLSHLETDTECQDYVRFDQIGDITVLWFRTALALCPMVVGANRVKTCVSDYILKLTIRLQALSNQEIL